ncbi:hypothetical protein OIU77_004957 [Salix suchowensis]|uniref:Uncharacterized protein n=1 Tax=Salix suchowensis TaxID=1278906 RepID=A0ABQ9AZ04_9ROSI|nr:hypothetical protein OIU77_004957 [Salix suchowensis]
MLLGSKVKIDPFHGTYGAKWIHDNSFFFLTDPRLYRNVGGGFGCNPAGQSLQFFTNFRLCLVFFTD